MSYEIVKSNLPSRLAARANGRSQYPFGAMAVGDYFEFPMANANRVRSAASTFGKNFGVKFATEKWTEDNGRCYRVK